jgi:hypothetical protein
MNSSKEKKKLRQERWKQKQLQMNPTEFRERQRASNKKAYQKKKSLETPRDKRHDRLKKKVYMRQYRDRKRNSLSPRVLKPDTSTNESCHDAPSNELGSVEPMHTAVVSTILPASNNLKSVAANRRESLKRKKQLEAIKVKYKALQQQNWRLQKQVGRKVRYLLPL